MADTDVSRNPQDYRCHISAPVRFKDLDAMGHVNNAVYFTYFESGREGYMKALEYPDPGFGPIFDRFPFILAEIRCQYLAPVMMDDEIVVHLRVSRIGTRAWDFDYLITHADQGHPIATGRSTQVFFDSRTREVRPIPESFAAAIERFEGRSLRDG